MTPSADHSEGGPYRRYRATVRWFRTITQRICLAFGVLVFGVSTMGLIDTHTHLESFAHHGTLPGILTRARDAGLDAMITIGTSTEDWGLYRRLAAENPGFVHYTVGLHPCAVQAGWEAAMAKIEAFWSSGDSTAAANGGASLAAGSRPVALGEIGLDRFHLPKEPGPAAELFAQQRAAFAAGLQAAKRLDTCVVVHSRGAFRECVEMIDASGVDWRRVVFHCFTEGEPEMAELSRRGGRGSFTGVVTYKNAANVRAAAKLQGLERMMVETDAPYLTPMPHRGKPNEPAYVRLTAEYCAREIFGVPDEEFAKITSANARQFFGI